MKANRACEQCVYYSFQNEQNAGKCWRFARFVEHVLTRPTRDCDYFTAYAEGPPSEPDPQS